MTETAKTLTSAEFSERTGLSVATVTKMLRQGTLRGEKQGGKWAIFESEATNFASISDTPAATSARSETYPIETFVQMTYLTEKGVRQFLKTGRLSQTWILWRLFIDHFGRDFVLDVHLPDPGLVRVVVPVTTPDEEVPLFGDQDRGSGLLRHGRH